MYLYGRASPVRFVDPSGTQDVDYLEGGSGAGGGTSPVYVPTEAERELQRTLDIVNAQLAGAAEQKADADLVRALAAPPPSGTAARNVPERPPWQKAAPPPAEQAAGQQWHVQARATAPGGQAWEYSVKAESGEGVAQLGELVSMIGPGVLAKLARIRAVSVAARGRMYAEGAGKGEPFDPQKLQRMIDALGKQSKFGKPNIEVVLSDDLLKAAQWDPDIPLLGYYEANPEGPGGVIVLGSNPSRATVIEEFAHLGQDRLRGWARPNMGGTEVGRLSEELIIKEKQLSLKNIQWTDAERALLEGKKAWYEHLLTQETAGRYGQ